MKIRTKFHITLYGVPLVLFIGTVSAFMANCPKLLILILDVIFFIVYWLLIENFRCPHCHVKLIEFYRAFSKYYKGFHFFLKEKCENCGNELD